MSMATCVMKQLREKHLSFEIKKCYWSPKMDLMAIVNIPGQVSLHRLSWQQVWVLNSPGESTTVTAIAWRPDSKILAIGYSSGKIYLVNIEDSNMIHQLQFNSEITALSWNNYFPSITRLESMQECQDPWAPFVYSLTPLSKSFVESGSHSRNDEWQEPRLLQDQEDLNLLCIGTEGGHLHLYAFGLFHVASIGLGEIEPRFHGKVLHIVPSALLDFFSVIVEKEEDGEKVIGEIMLDSSLISRRHTELHSLAQKYGQIYSLITYARHTLTLMEEAWESTLIEMDAKLASYAMTVPEGCLSSDFLELLVFGHSTTEFEIFLTSKLTEKGLKKLRHSVDLCYSTMQRLVVHHLQQMGVTLIFLLSQLEGMSKRKDKFAPLGVQEKEVTVAVGQAASFLLKASEMLQAIDSSMKDFHSFVRWVTGVHLRLLHEQPPPDLCRMSQQEMSNLLNFLNESFEAVETGADGTRRTRFRLERAGQYLKDENLKMSPSLQAAPFTRLIESNPSLASHRLIFEHHKDTSLIQEHSKLSSSLKAMGSQSSRVISMAISSGRFVPLSKAESSSQALVGQISIGNGSILTALVPSVKHPKLILIEWPSTDCTFAKAASFFFSIGDGRGVVAAILDIQFYSQETLSVLLQDPLEPRASSFAQVSVEIVRKELFPWQPGEVLAASRIPAFDITCLPDAVAIRRLETGPACMMAVSGPRKVAAVVGENRRRIRIYEMEGEEDEDDEDEDETRNEVNASATSDELNETL